MSSPTSASQWRDARRGDVVARAIVLLAPLGALAAAGAASRPFGAPVFVAIGLGAAITAWSPDSAAGTAVVLGLGWAWLARVDRELTVWTLIAAACIVVFHTAAAWSALAPLGSAVDRRLVARWARRTLAVLAAAVVTFAACALAAKTSSAGNAVVLALALAAVAAIAAALAALIRSGDGEGRSVS